MKNLKRMIVLALVVLLVASAFAGCGGSTVVQKETSTDKSAAASSTVSQSDPNKPDISEPVQLTMYLIGDAPTDAQLVYDEINKKLKKDINATVTPNFLPWADWKDRYPLLLASGEDYDLIISAWWSQYTEQARKGAFLELTDDLLNKYAPMTMKSVDNDRLKWSKVDSKLYILPMNYSEFATYGYIVRGDLMKKYNIHDIKTIDDFGAYLDAVAKNEKALIPWDTGNDYDKYIVSKLFEFQNGWYTKDGIYGLALDTNQPNGGKWFIEAQDPKMVDFYKKMADWKNKGYWSQNALVNKVSAKDSFVNGRSASFGSNLLDASAVISTVKAQHPDWDAKFYPGTPEGKTFANPVTSNGISINAKSKHPDRALMMLDLFRNNEDYFDLTTYGIEGKHYTLTPEGKIKSLPDSSKYPIDGACPWGWREAKFYRSVDGSISNYDDVLKSYTERWSKSPIENYFPDFASVMDKQAALKTVSDQYGFALQLGFSKDVEKDVKTMLDKYKAAGIDDFLSAVQKQYSDFVQANQ